jgi:hypothetical protein
MLLKGLPKAQTPSPARSVAGLDQLKHLGTKASESTLTIKRIEDGLCSLVEITGLHCAGGLLLKQGKFSLQSGALINRSCHWGNGPG